MRVGEGNRSLGKTDEKELGYEAGGWKRRKEESNVKRGKKTEEEKIRRFGGGGRKRRYKRDGKMLRGEEN